MATNFPGNLDSLATVVDNVDDALASHQNNNADAIEALEAKVGINNSAVATSIDYKLRYLPTQDGITKVTNLNADLLDGAEGTAYFPARSGDILLSSTTAPTGWEEVTAAYTGKYIRVGASALDTGGSSTHTHAAGSYLGPDHVHTGSTSVVSLGGSGINFGGDTYTHVHSFTTGGAGTGSVTGTSAAGDTTPLYLDLRMYKKV